MINSPSTKSEDILDNLEKGNAYGFDFIRHDDEPMETKYERSKHIPHLVSAKLSGDTLNIEVSKKAELFKFIGQGGKTLQTNKKAKTAQYIIQPGDTYVRTEIGFADKSGIYLNPIVRYEGDSLQSKLSSEIDKAATLLLRLAYFIIVVLLVVFYVKRRKKMINA